MNPMPSNNTVNEEIDGAACYKKLEAELVAIPEDQLAPVNLDVPSSVMIVLGCLPKVIALRDRIKQALIEFDAKNLDSLEDYTVALSYAHAQFMIGTEPTDDLKELYAEGMQSRDRLHSDAGALCVRHLIDPSKLNDYSGLTGYKNVALDLQILVSALTEKWDTVANRCAIDQPELVRADKVATRMLRLTGLREQRRASLAERTLIRARAFTAFCCAYDQVRRAVTWLRWDEGDADEIAPSLWKGRGHKHVDAAVEGAPAAASPAPAPAPGLAAAPAAAPFAGPAPVNTPKAPVPGSNPFMQ